MSIKNGVPSGFSTVTAHLTVDGAAKAIEYYQRAFGAEELMRLPGPGGTLMHAEIKIGDSIVWLADENPQYGNKSPKTLGGSPVAIHLFVSDVDKAFERAVKEGAKAVQPPTDMPWGARFSRLTDPFGQNWSIATQVREVSPADMAAAMKASAK